METAMIVVAVGAIVLAAVLLLVKQMKRSANPPQSAGFAAMRVPSVKPKGPPPPMPPEKKQWKVKKMKNKRGWKAPAGHYFNDDDELVTDLGSLIVNMSLIAQLCGERHDGFNVELVPKEPVGTETIASHPEPAAEVTSDSSLDDLQTKDTGHTPVSHSGSTHSYDSGGDCSSGGGGGCDSGGDSGDSGGCD